MAGAGAKKWTAGDTLTASDVNTYLMDQAVMVFNSSSDRDNAFGGTGEPTLAEGMFAFLKDSNKLTIYNGSAWVEMLDTDSPPTNTTPAGSDHQVQFNDNGSFGADANFTYDGAKIIAGTDFFATAKMQTGQNSFTQEPWSDTTIALGDYGSIGTQGSYRTYMSWNYERGTDSNFHHLDVNSYPQAGHVAIGNGGIIFGFDPDFETTHTANPATRVTINDTEMNVTHKIRLGTDATNGPFMTSETDEVRIENNHGYIDLGPKSASGVHIYGSMANMFFGIQGTAAYVMTADEFYPYGTSGTKELGIAGNIWERLHINEIYADDGSAGDPSYTFTGDTDTGMYSTSNVLRFSTGGSQRGLFSSSGFYAIKAVSTGTYAFWASTGYLVAFSSSQRYKENIQNMPKSDWEKVYDLQAVTFDWKDDGSVEIDPNRGKEDHGFIAEDVEKILPKVVNYDAIDHEDLSKGYQIQSVNYGELTPYLVEAVKDLKARIETLESA